MTKKDIYENGWKMDHEELMWAAADAGFTYKEFKEYEEKMKKQATEARRDLIGSYKGAETLYEDAIIKVVGEKFLTLFKKFGMIESCGIIGGRKLYAL